MSQPITNLRLYGLINALRNRLEIESEQGKVYSAKQIAEAIRKVNEVNEILDRRKASR